ncbi:hypothetical protein [Shewanella baltica]|uniref:hypothetical protein n=1 Tax=Shewanella baltica TaxID=62322 RepID=UPI0039B0128E
MSKFVWELTPQDLLEHSVWQFLHWKDDAEDETVVGPASESDAIDPNASLIVKAIFTDSNGDEFLGYVRFGQTGIANTQPCMFIGEATIGFWFGISKPDCSELRVLSFPITIVTKCAYDLPTQVEIMKGFGFFDLDSGSKVRYCEQDQP